MTTKRWNARVATVLSMLLSITLTAPAEGTQPQGDPAADSAAANSRAQAVSAANRSVAVHRITIPADDPNRLDVELEAIPGVLVGDGTLPGTIELLLTGARIPDDLARSVAPGCALVEDIQFTRSAWGHEHQARIVLAVADGVTATTRAHSGLFDVILSNDGTGGERFVLRFIEAPYPELDAEGAATIRRKLENLAARGVGFDAASWWKSATARSQVSERSATSVTPAALAAVRDAEVTLPRFDEIAFAAQQEEAPPESGGDGSGAAPAFDEAAPAVDEAEPAPEPEEPAVDPPAKRQPSAPNTAAANKELTRQLIAGEQRLSPESPMQATKRKWTGDPLRQPVTIDFRDMDLLNVVQILADMAEINVVAGADLTGPVTLNLRDVPLMQAMETALRLNGLGIVEEEGIYHIRPYVDAIASKRVTEVVDIEHADAGEIITTLQSVIRGSEFESLISLSSNETANTVILAGPEGQIKPLVTLARRLDVEQMSLPTATVPVKLNYAEPQDMLAAVQGMLTPEVGQVSVDERARMLVVTDIPIVVEQIQDLVKQLDIPVKQVSIDAMIVDVTLTDDADTGVDWIISAVQSQSRRDAAANSGIFTGNLQELSLSSALDVGETAGLLNFGILSGDIDWRGVIQAEVRNNNSTLLSNPKLITVENQTATITIASEIPYTELTSTEQGGQQTSTEFKPIGTTLEVTPKVTHDDHIIAKINAKESTSSQVVNGVPVEDLREIDTTPHIASGQTIYVGGLRKNNDTVSVRKVPVLGDVPVVNFLFRSNQRSETVNELLIFLTCSIIEDQPTLTAYQQEQADRVRSAGVDVSAETALIYDTVHPSKFRDPAWKWRKHSDAPKKDKAGEMKADVEMEESEPQE